jgi:TonB family protein
MNMTNAKILKPILLVVALFSISGLYSATSYGTLESDFIKTEQPDTTIYILTEVPAVFPGGDMARIQYLFRNLEYPEVAQEQGIQGTVFVSFVVEIDGSITNVSILRGLSPEIDQEVLRLVNDMPNWAPGRIKGKPVRTIFRMPVKFALLSEDDYVQVEPPAPEPEAFDITRDAVVFVNGKKQEYNLQQLDNKIKSNDIQSIEYYLDGKGSEKFGFPNVVSIKTKKGWKP